eukprot:gene7464-8888_t
MGVAGLGALLQTSDVSGAQPHKVLGIPPNPLEQLQMLHQLTEKLSSELAALSPESEIESQLRVEKEEEEILERGGSSDCSGGSLELQEALRDSCRDQSNLDSDGSCELMRVHSNLPLPEAKEEHKVIGLPYGGESVLLMSERWRKLCIDLYNKKKGMFNISKVPDIYDSAKYDIVHNSHMGLSNLDELFTVAKSLADGATWSWEESLKTAKTPGGTELGERGEATATEDEKATEDDETKKKEEEDDTSDDEENDTDVRSPYRHVRSRLYFTSESHIHSLINVLRFAHLDSEHSATEKSIVSDDAHNYLDLMERDYLTHIVIRMYEDMEKDIGSPERFRLELLCSPGAHHRMKSQKDKSSSASVSGPPVMPFIRMQHVSGIDPEMFLTHAKFDSMLSKYGSKEKPQIPQEKPEIVRHSGSM